MNKTLFITSLAWLSASTTVFAGWLALYSALPNTVDDTNLEYIEVQNASCASIQIARYTLRDAAGSIFILPSETLTSGAIRRFMRPETRITLNNTDETLELRSPSGETIDTRSYTTSTKWVGIMFSVNPYGSCTTEIITEVTTTVIQGSGSLTLTGTTLSGSISSGTGIFMGSGSIFSQSGTTQSGSTIWGVSAPWINTGALIGTGTLTGSWIFTGSSISTNSWAITNISSTGNSTVTMSGVLSSTGSTGWVSLSGSTNSGSLAPSTWWLLTQTGSNTGVLSSASPALSTQLIPLLLKIIDSDRNGKVDRLSIEYSGTLTGTLRLDKFVLYSSTGGLSSSRIDTGSWVVRSLTLSGSELLIDLNEQDLVRTDLRINATVESHLRVKTLSDFGLTDLMGMPVQALTLTESFQKYAPAYIRNEAYIPVVPVSTPSSTVFVMVNPSTLSPSPSILPATPITSVISSTPAVTQPLSPVMPTARILPTIRVQSGVSEDGACRTTACSINLVANWVNSSDVCQWLIIPKSGLQFQRLGCNPWAFLVGAQGWVIQLDIIWAGLSGFQATLSIRGFTKMNASNKKSKTLTIPPKSTKDSDKNPESIDIFEEYFEMVDEDGNIVTISPKDVTLSQAISPKKVSKSWAKDAPKLSAKSTKKSAKKASTAQPTTVKTTKTTKTTKVSKPPTLPKSIEKPQKNPVPTTPASITPTTIGIVWLLCSALGFGVAIYRRRDS